MDHQKQKEDLPLMCNLYSMTTNQEAIRRLFDVAPEFDLTGNLEGGEIYPRRSAPIIRQREDGAREMVMTEWGFPRVKRELKKDGTPYAPTPSTNIRNSHYLMWRDWRQDPQYRCLVPVTKFAEPNPKAKQARQPKDIWFDVAGAEEGVFAFAGLWRSWEGDWIKARGNKQTEVHAFYTCEPNALVKPIHPKAMPVILHPDDYEAWLNGSWDEVKSLQAPFPEKGMRIIDGE